MNTIKLTPAQKQVVEDLKHGWIIYHYIGPTEQVKMERQDSALQLFDKKKQVSLRVFKALLEKGILWETPFSEFINEIKIKCYTLPS